MVRDRSQREAAEMASREIDRLGERTTTHQERVERKHRLIKGLRTFRQVREDLPKTKR